jgi:hypothetical protein
MSYYGSGTEISLSADHPKFFGGIDTSISLDDILTNGITGVPWVYRTFDETVGEKGDTLTLAEYQYITLAEGDVLSSISLNETVQRPLSKWWQKVATATFNMGGEIKKLPKIDIVDHNKKTLG